jgi:hypothetical protein
MNLQYYKNKQLAFVFNKKLSNNLFCEKSFIRAGSLTLLDRYNCFEIIDTKLLSKTKKFLELKNFFGYSLNTKEVLYTHKLNSLLSFKLHNSFSNKFIKRLCFDFEKDLLIVSGNKLVTNIYRSLLILKNIKGGFIAFSCGFKGFLPKSQFILFKNKLLKDFFFTFLKSKAFYKKVLTNFFYFSTQIKKNKVYRCFFFNVKITRLMPYSKPKRYSLSVNRTSNKSFKYITVLSIVFLVKNKNYNLL